MKFITRSTFILVAVTAASAAAAQTAQEVPASIGRQYLSCMSETASKYRRGGAPMELAIDTSAIKCEDRLQDIRDHFANPKSRADEVARDAVLTGVRRAGRVMALDAMTAEAPQTVPGAPRASR